MAQDMVSVTLTGFRLATSAADTATEAAIAGPRPTAENEFISSMTVGLVTRSAVGAARPHQNATANQRRRPAACSGFASWMPALAAGLARVQKKPRLAGAGGGSLRGSCPRFDFRQLCCHCCHVRLSQPVVIGVVMHGQALPHGLGG